MSKICLCRYVVIDLGHYQAKHVKWIDIISVAITVCPNTCTFRGTRHRDGQETETKQMSTISRTGLERANINIVCVYLAFIFNWLCNVELRNFGSV